MSLIVHVAGEPDGKIQKCSRCPLILTDYRNAMGVGKDGGPWSPGFWEPGVEVVVANGGMKFVRDENLKTDLEIPCNASIH